MEQILPMSLQQLNKLDILRRVERQELSQTKAAQMLGIVDRTVRRQLARLEQEGPGFLIHGLKGQVSNNRIPLKVEERIGALLKQKYPDFGSTFASEKLREIHHLDYDPKTIARIQKSLGLYTATRKATKVVYHSYRVRRALYGDLIQFDGSYHDWLEGRGSIDELCLLLAVDDATGKIVYAWFAPHEGVLPVMGFWLEYASLHGLPKQIYLDRFSTYSMNVKLAAQNPDTLTQFERAARDTGVEVVHAYSSQAKGRVENKFGTLQDRLVKELRLAGICTVEDANRFLQDVFIPDFNQRFGVEARHKGDLHRTPSKTELEDVLPYIFCRKDTRVIQNDFTISYDAAWYQLLPTPRLAMRPKDVVDVHKHPDESLSLLVRGKPASFLPLPEKPQRRTRSKHPQTLTI
jgi:transposase